MNLEDHSGDIFSKGREAAGLTIHQCAALANVSPDVIERWESSNEIPAGIDWEKLAQAIRLNIDKLRKIAGGWTPVAPDLSQWRELRRITTTEAGLSVHAYLIWDEVNREAALVDTGWDASPLLQLIGEENLVLKHIFLTHSHADHIAGLEKIRAAFPKAFLHTGSKNAPPQHRNRPNDFIHLGSLRISNRETPGHAEDGVTYVIGNWPEDAPHVAIVGDALFAGSMGRGNISWEVAREKVREQILSLPVDTLLCPGHGPFTTVAEEKEHNPFF